MSSMRRLCAAFALTCVLATAATAGEISCPVVAPPAPPLSWAAAGDTSPAAAGEISCGLQAAAALVQAALSVF